MRRIILRKRQRLSGVLFFAAISWVGLGMGFDIRSGMITRDFQAFIQARLNSVFVGKEVRLSRVETGVLKNFTVDGFTIYNKAPEGGRVSAPIFSVDRIIVKYNILDMLQRRFDKLSDVYLVSPSISLYGSGGESLKLPSESVAFIKNVDYICPTIKFHILNGVIMGSDPKLALTNLNGTVQFCDSSLILDNVKGSLLGLPVLVNGQIEHVFNNPVIKLRILSQGQDYKANIYFKRASREEEARVYGKFVMADRFSMDVKGNMSVTRAQTVRIRDLVLGGLFKTSGDIYIPDKTSRFIIKPRVGSGSVKVIAGLEKDRKGAYLRARLSHLNVLGFDLLSQIDVNAGFYKTANASEILSGSINTHNLIINYKPFKEISARWTLKKDELFVNSIELGGEYKLSGSVKTTSPYDANILFTVNNAFPGDWLIFSRHDLTGIISGTMNGKLSLKGPIRSPVTKGKFDVLEGNLKNVKFDSMILNLNGKGPILSVSDSRIRKDDGFLFIEGWIDAGQVGKRNIFEHIKIQTDQKVIVWEGWDISKSVDTTEVQLKKDVSDEFNVNFKTRTNTDYTGREKQENEMGLDYKIKKNDSINVRMKNDSGFVGVEHKVKF